jgi:putative transposase
MGKVNFTPEQIALKLRDIEAQCEQGVSIAEASRQSSISEQTYYRWRKIHGGTGASDARRLKDLEQENATLKRLVVVLSLENAVLKEI